MSQEQYCLHCATLESADLVLDFFEERFLQAHPEVQDALGEDYEFGQILEAAEKLADADDESALDLMVAFGLWGKIEEDLAGPSEDEILD